MFELPDLDRAERDRAERRRRALADIDANARLRNSAPALLRACMKALAELSGTKETCDGQLGTIAVLQLAIKEATGEGES